MLKEANRFEVILEESGFTYTRQILLDTATGVQYLYVMPGGGLCPLLDADGKPLRTN